MTWRPALFAILTACGATNDPWDDPNYLLGSSVLDRALDLGQTPRGAHDEAVLCVSTSGWGVDMRCRTFAHSVSTFDLHETKGGLLLFVGLNLRRWGHDRVSLGHAYALTTPDLERFGSRIWEVRDTKLPFLTDLALEDLPDGRRRMVYVSGGADAPGVHTVRAALGRGDDWREAEPALYADEGLLDPSACSAGGTYHLFATKHHAIVHATGTDPWHYAEDPAFSWIGAQVPSCFDDAGTLTVVAQAGGGWGAPVLRTLDKDGGFSAPRPLWEPGRYPDLASCTSPVLRRFREQYVLICAVSRLSQAPQETQLPDGVAPTE